MKGQEANSAKAPDPTPKSTAFSRLCQYVTIEPAFIITITGLAIHIITAENLLIEKVCLTENKYPEDVCANIQDDAYSDDLTKVQTKVAYWKTAIGISSTIPSIIYSIIIGSWSDKHGRKPFIVLPIAGIFMSTLIYIVIACFKYSPVWLFVVQSLVIPMFGGYGLFVCTTSYVTDISSKKSRTVRLAILEACVFLSLPLGIFIGGEIYKLHGYLAVFITSTVLEFIAVLYTVFVLKESKKDIVPASFKQKVRDLFRFGNIVESFKAFNAPREKRIKRILIIILIVSVLTNFSQNGIRKVKYLFTQKEFGWSVTDYSTYESISLISGMVFAMLIIGIFSYKLKIGDSILAASGDLIAIFGSALVGNAVFTWMLYAGTILGTAQTVQSITMKSILTKIIADEDIGKVLSFLICCEQASPIIADSIYPIIWAKTSDFFPGLLFIANAYLFLIPLAFFLWLTLDQVKKPEKQPLVINDQEKGYETGTHQ